MEPQDFTDMLKQFGPYGVCIFFMFGAFYLFVKQSRDERSQANTTQKEQRMEFLTSLKEQRVEHTDSLRGVADKYEMVATEQNRQLERMSDKIDSGFKSLHEKIKCS